MFLSFALSHSIIIIISFYFMDGLCEKSKTGLKLNEYIHHFEPLFYDHRHLQEAHRRSTMDQHFSFHFSAHNRLFRLRLKRDISVFADDIQFENTHSELPYDTSRVLAGYLEDEEDSIVEAIVTHAGFLDGVVKIAGEEFYIEPAKNYLSTPHDFHSIIYKLSDVHYSPQNMTCLSHLIQHPNNKACVQKGDLSPRTVANKPCVGFEETERKYSIHKRGIRFADASMKHRKRSHAVKENFKKKYKSPKLRHFQSTKSRNSRNHKHHQYRTNIKTNQVVVSPAISLPKKSKNGKPLLYSHKLNESDGRDFLWYSHFSINESLVTGDSISVTQSTHGSSKELRPNNPIDSLGFTNTDMFEGLGSDDSHEDHSGNYSEDIARSKGVQTNVAYNSSFNGQPKLDVKIFMKDFPSNDEISSKNEDFPYWRELDALYYTEDGRTGSSEPYGVRSIQRTQWTEDRGQRHVAVDRRKSTCLLYLQADHLFYQKMGSEETCIEAMTRHVQRVNNIYRSTDFDQDGRPDNISFLIKRIKVHTSPDHNDYRFVGNYGVEKFLELFSEDDYDAFCLAYMFTYRDFEGGTLGLAWTGDLKNAGGVCEKNGHYRGSLKSLNTGIITLLNYGKYVPPVVSHVTLAHEIGHNFGSPHDPEDDQHCTPGGDHGNYIMFARATSGDKRNNNKFSPCSLRSINAVLNTKARSVKGCFTEPLDAVCGNEVVEGTEECDCGWEEDCHEPCCFPMRVNPPQSQPPCRLRPAAFCSPSQGPCCSRDCRLKYGNLCREDNGCRTSAYCDGKGPQCPSSTKKPNKTVCSEEFVCYNGECTGSICMAYGLESCQCTRTIHDPIIRSCELCCKLPGDESSCKSSFEWNLTPYDVPDLYAKPGAPCDNYNGYCDVHQSCREIDPSGPLATLRKLLLSPEGAIILRRWFAEKWWGIILLFVAVTFTVVISARLLSRGQSKSFLSTILPQSDFRFCHGRSSSRSTYIVTNNMKKSRSVPRPRVSSAPENGWV